MARLGPLLVREMCPPPEVIPACAWSEVVAECGDMVVAVARTTRNAAGALQIGYAINATTVAAVRRVLERHGYEPEGGDTPDPFNAAPIAGPWTRPADWWKADA